MMEKQIYPLNIAPGEQPKPQSPIPTAPKKPTFKEWIKSKKWIFAGVLGVLVVGGGVYAALTMDFGENVKGMMQFSEDGKLGIEIESVTPEDWAVKGLDEVTFTVDFADLIEYTSDEESLLTKISIDYGDGTGGDVAAINHPTTFKHTYDFSGSKTITVWIVPKNGGSASDTIDYEIKKPEDVDPFTDFIVTPSWEEGNVNMTLGFDVETTGGFNHMLLADWSDGSDTEYKKLIGGKGTLTHEYTQAGDYQITVVACNNVTNPGDPTDPNQCLTKQIQYKVNETQPEGGETDLLSVEKNTMILTDETLSGNIDFTGFNTSDIANYTLNLKRNDAIIKEIISGTEAAENQKIPFSWDGKINSVFQKPGEYVLELTVIQPGPAGPQDLIIDMFDETFYTIPKLKKLAFKDKATLEEVDYLNIDNKNFDTVEIQYEVGELPLAVGGKESVVKVGIVKKNSEGFVDVALFTNKTEETFNWDFKNILDGDVEYGEYLISVSVASDEYLGLNPTGVFSYDKTIELKLAALEDATLETFQFVDKNGQPLNNPVYDNYEPPTENESDTADEVFVEYEIENLGLETNAAIFVYEEDSESAIIESPWMSTSSYKWEMTANDLYKLELNKTYKLKVATTDPVYGDQKFVEEITLKVGEAEPVLPKCSDLIDNDEDGTIDLLDLGCESPTDNTEDPDPVIEDPITCTYNNKSYAIDETFDAADTCNTCTCDDDGGISCTTEVCEPDTDTGTNTDTDPDPDPDPADAPPTLDLGLNDAPTPAQCDDDLDNDDDGDTDYPEDEGCTSINDTTENSEGSSNSQNETIEITKVSISKATFNPYINEVQILYTTSEDANVTVSIYNMKGEKIVDLLSEEQTKGDHNVWWTGTVNNKTLGKKVDDGSYIFKITAAHKQYPTIKDTKEGTVTVNTQTSTNPGDFEDLDGGGAEPAGDPEPQGTLGSTPVTPDQLIATQTLQNSTTGQSAGTGPGVLIYLLIPALALPFKPKKND
jgi:hypothetical protein